MKPTADVPPAGPAAGQPTPARPRGPTYRAKLITGVCGLVVLTGSVVTWLAHRSARANAEALTDRLFREVSGHAVTHTRAFVGRAEPIVESLRGLAATGLDLDDSDGLAAHLLAVLEANPGLSWIHYGDEAGTFTGVYRPREGGLRINQSRIVNGRTRLVEHDVLADGTRRIFRTDDDSGYDPRQRPYYRKAREQGRLVWLPPYVFYNQGVPGVSCAAPVWNKAGRLRGVLGVDFDLVALSDFVARLKPSPNASVFLFTDDGHLLAHPNARGRKAAGRHDEGKLPTLADTGDPLVEAFRARLRPEDLRAEADETFHSFGFFHDGTEHLASTNAFRVGDDLTWVVGALTPRSDFLAGVWRSQALALAASAGALLGAAVLAVVLARSVSGPVLSLIGFMRRVGAGDLEARAELGGGREFRELSAALNRMIADLRDRLQVRHSLAVAMDVQQRLLPQRPPHVRGMDVAGHSTYCDETGGDYYDFLVLDKAAPDTLLVALGDVMGHGVAAALVMAGARAVLRDRVGTAGSLADLMNRLNAMLAADLEGTRFMTMHLSSLDSRTGMFRWVSAGHDPALIFDPAADRFDEIEIGSLPLGVLDDTEYTEASTGPLRPGQVIFIGTDGVWEMPNAAGEQFGKPRLREVIRAAASGSAAEMVQAVVDRLVAFRGESRPVDDVTFVVIKLTPAEKV